MESFNINDQMEELHKILEGYLAERLEYVTKREEIYQDIFLVDCQKNCYIGLIEALSRNSSEEAKIVISTASGLISNFCKIEEESKKMCNIINSMIKDVDVCIHNIQSTISNWSV